MCLSVCGCVYGAGKLAPSEKKLANSLDSAWKDITSDHLDVSPRAFYKECVCVAARTGLGICDGGGEGDSF